MKKILTICLLFFSMTCYAQISGGFYLQKDIYGCSYVCFSGQNTSIFNYYVQIACVNEKACETKYFSLFSYAGQSFTIGPNEGWVWMPGEKLYVKYASGQIVYWTYNPNVYKPTFQGRKYDCERCLCTKYEKKSTFNSDCKCGHPKNYHYSQK